MFAILLKDPGNVAVKQKVHELIEKLAVQPENGIEDVLDETQIANLGDPQQASYVVTLRKGYSPGANLSGALITPVPGHRGTHGYNPQTTPEMGASFFAAGGGLAHGKDLGTIDMRSIAPTLAGLLEVALPDAKQILNLR